MTAVFVPYLVFGSGGGLVSLALFPRSQLRPEMIAARVSPLRAGLEVHRGQMLFSFLRTAFSLTAMNFLPSYLMGFKG